jgi:hypothetical protein
MNVFYRKSVCILYTCKYGNQKSSYVEEHNITHCTYVTNENRPRVWEKRNLTHTTARALSHQSKKACISFFSCMSVRVSVCLSVSPHLPVRLPLDGLSWNLILGGLLRKSVEEIRMWLKSDKNMRYFTGWTHKYVHIGKLRAVNHKNVVCFLLGNSPVSEFYMPTFRNIVYSIFIGR